MTRKTFKGIAKKKYTISCVRGETRITIRDMSNRVVSRALLVTDGESVLWEWNNRPDNADWLQNMALEKIRLVEDKDRETAVWNYATPPNGNPRWVYAGWTQK